MNIKVESSLLRFAEVGAIETVSGSSATCRLDRSIIEQLQATREPCVSKTGAVGGNLKFKVDASWIIAEITDVAVAHGESNGGLVAHLSFLGQGAIGEDGRLTSFERGVSTFPRPGDKACAVMHDDLLANLKLPHWMMNFEEHCEALITSTGEDYEFERGILAKCLLKARSLNEEAPTIPNLNVDTPIPYALFDLLGAIDAEMGKLEKVSKASSYLRLKLRVEDLMRDKRFDFMFGAQLYSYPLIGLVSGLLRMPNEGKPISIIDLSKLPSEIVSVVVALISRSSSISPCGRVERSCRRSSSCARKRSATSHPIASPSKRRPRRSSSASRKKGVNTGFRLASSASAPQISPRASCRKAAPSSQRA